MTALIERISDRLLQQIAPKAEVAAIDRCNCSCVRCCIRVGSEMKKGKLCYDCISGGKCWCQLTTSVCW